MKKFLSISLLALGALVFAEQKAQAWINSKFGIGLSWHLQSANNSTLWGMWRNGQIPGPEAFGPVPPPGMVPPGYPPPPVPAPGGVPIFSGGPPTAFYQGLPPGHPYYFTGWNPQMFQPQPTAPTVPNEPAPMPNVTQRTSYNVPEQNANNYHPYLAPFYQPIGYHYYMPAYYDFSPYNYAVPYYWYSGR
jgi:hypothetical protein